MSIGRIDHNREIARDLDRCIAKKTEMAATIAAQAATIERLRSYINASDALESCLALAGEDGTTCVTERAEAITTYVAIRREDMGEVDVEQQPTCGYCRDCRWWKGYLPAMQWGDCVKARDVGAKAIPYTPDRYEDTDLQTELDFGCVQFEALASADNVDDHNDTR